jgi:hypothetical protein
MLLKYVFYIVFCRLINCLGYDFDISHKKRDERVEKILIRSFLTGCAFHAIMFIVAPERGLCNTNFGFFYGNVFDQTSPERLHASRFFPWRLEEKKAINFICEFFCGGGLLSLSLVSSLFYINRITQ